MPSLRELMTKNVITISKDASVGEALNKMERGAVHQLIAMDGKSVAGLVTLRDIVIRNVPLETKISNFIVNAPFVDASGSAESAAEAVLRSGLRALPVMEKGRLAGIVSESDLMGLVNSKRGIEELATPCGYVSASDSVGKVTTIMFSKNVSRVPVMEKDSLIGVVGTLDLIKVLRARESMRGGRLQEMGAREKLNIEKVQVRTIMGEPVSLSPQASLLDAAKLLKTNEEVFVVNGDVRILTPKDVLEAQLGAMKRGVLVQITNLDDESSFVVDKMHAAAAEFIRKAGRMIRDLEYLYIHIDRYKKGGARMRYSVRTRFSTPLGLFVSKADGWDLVGVTQDAIDKLETEVFKRHERLKKEKTSKRAK